MTLTTAFIVVYAIGIIAAISQLAEFQGSQYRYRANIKRAYLACWLLLIVPVFNLAAACYLLSILRDAARRERDAWVNIRMTFPSHYDNRAGDLGEDEHA